MRQFNVLGLPVHIQDSYSAWLAQRLQNKQGAHVVTLNAEMTMQARQNFDLASVVKQADLVVPDGSGIVLYLRSQGEDINRCPGIELAEQIVAIAAEKRWSIYLLGGAPNVVDTVVDSWRQKWATITIAGMHHGYFDADLEQQICEQLQTLQPDLLLVGLGVPRQELWIQKYRHLCPNSVWIGVGGSFDIWSGKKTRAPKWFANNNLEWLYRLYQEPWRWRRMLSLPHFVWCVTKESLLQKAQK
ncbi:WecB/TagA/CpsF family glycosyltransferase [Pseudanabaena sp. FACHB-1998]|uniref:WecB/TagA/CpsF family glycosyltransferase n=1 Tax=Pseudanabaena sp. FACHB-1998 TaxID=2692858 RepID=UPI001680556C|nr:WecB/TagA/CpsF family glycosyltransferase [Pseudanabaena sp. FACHB-1998]MBD2178053.1 WecB/TagA/CpsF family glycosyltransferase [Pseudanabaena sp. FACHB-1998]